MLQCARSENAARTSELATLTPHQSTASVNQHLFSAHPLLQASWNAVRGGFAEKDRDAVDAIGLGSGLLAAALLIQMQAGHH